MNEEKSIFYPTIPQPYVREIGNKKMSEEKQENVSVENLFTPAETEGSIKLKLADGEKELKVGDVVFMINFGYFAEFPLCRPYWFIERLKVSSFRAKFNVIDFERWFLEKASNIHGYEYSLTSEPSYSIQKGHSYFNGIFSDYEKALEFAKKFSRKAKKALTV